jgi:hypothetical protein
MSKAEIEELEDKLHGGIEGCEDDCTACRLRCEWRREHEHITGI